MRTVAALLLALLASCASPAGGTVLAVPVPLPPKVQQVLPQLPDPGHPVSIVLMPLDGLYGDAQWLEEHGRFLVRINSRLPEGLLAEVLAHEWAHLLVWDAVDTSDHGPIWGVAYARCYRILHGE